MIWSCFRRVIPTKAQNLGLKKYTKTKIKKLLKKNLPEKSDFISYEKNLNKAKTAFGKLFDVGGSLSVFQNRADELQTLNTSEITRQSVSATSLKREGMCFWHSGTNKLA